MASKTGNKSLAIIYAQALYEAAEQAQVLDQVASELEALRELIKKAPKLEAFLVSPTISFDEKRKTIESAFAEFSKITRNFLLVIVDRKRGQLLGLISSSFAEHANRKAGMAAVEVHTAREMNSEERSRLSGMLEKKLNKRVKLNERIRPELLGGMVLQHEDKLWDRSVASALKRMIETMDAVKLTQVKWMENGK
jgi:F-type H+-transporting ATPase subunit delta